MIISLANETVIFFIHLSQTAKYTFIAVNKIIIIHIFLRLSNIFKRFIDTYGCDSLIRTCHCRDYVFDGSKSQILIYPVDVELFAALDRFFLHPVDVIHQIRIKFAGEWVLLVPQFDECVQNTMLRRAGSVGQCAQGHFHRVTGGHVTRALETRRVERHDHARLALEPLRPAVDLQFAVGDRPIRVELAQVVHHLVEPRPCVHVVQAAYDHVELVIEIFIHVLQFAVIGFYFHMRQFVAHKLSCNC